MFHSMFDVSDGQQKSPLGESGLGNVLIFSGSGLGG
jgi:hypothetical protein